MKKSITRWLMKPCHKMNECINAALGGTHNHFIGFEYRLLIGQPLSRLLKILLSHVDYFLRNFKLPHAHQSGYIKDELMNGRCGYLSMVGKKVFYRRFVKAQPEPIQCLVEIQHSIDRLIYIMPLQDFFKFEFLYDADQSIEKYVDASLNAFVEGAILCIHPTRPKTSNKGAENSDQLGFYTAAITRCLKHLQT